MENLREKILMRIKNIKNNDKGFSLMEVVLAVSVLAIGILAVSVLQTSSVRMNSNARGITEASTYASDEMEYRMALNYQSAYLQDRTDEVDYVINSTCCPNHPAVRAGYAINTSIDDLEILNGAYLQTANMKRITVNVNWLNFGSFGANKSLTLESIKPRLR